MSAVSKKLMPSSSARWMNGRLASSSNTHGRHFDEPKVIAPRQMRETFKPLFPSRTYCMMDSEHRQDKLAYVRAGFHDAVSLGSRLQRKRLVHDHLDHA